MNKLQFYKSNAGLGYNQYVVLLELNKNDMLVVDDSNFKGDMYSLGEIIKDEEPKCIFIEKIDYSLEKCQFLNTFLGKYFIITYFK